MSPCINGENSEDGKLLSQVYVEGEEGYKASGLKRSTENSKNSIQFPIWKIPVHWHTDTVDELRELKCRHTGHARRIYDGPRFTKLFDEFERTHGDDALDEQTEPGPVEEVQEGVSKKLRLASLTLTLGTLTTYVLGRFIVERRQERTSVRLLNGYISGNHCGSA